MAKSKTSKSSPSGNGNHRRGNQLRLIGGRWRGRKLKIADSEGLRPTPDRVRETLFNWLAPYIQESHCLDLFSGSGALGIEALSRGANRVDLVDSTASVVRQLRENLQLLYGGGPIDSISTTDAQIWHNNAETQLREFAKEKGEPFDIIFLDPPFGKDLLIDAIKLIDDYGLLRNSAWVYIETGHNESLPTLPATWQLHREKTAGQVCYRLFSVNADMQ